MQACPPLSPDTILLAKDTAPFPMIQPALGTGVFTRLTMPPHFEHIFLIIGPAGCGKTTVARSLAQELDAAYVEGDDFHPPANIEKMASGLPLNDADRWDWLITLKSEAVKQLKFSRYCVVTCSALKKKYRDVIRVVNYEHPTVQVHFVFLKLPEEILQQRVSQRVGHYMKQDMVHSQLLALEEPDAEAEPDVIKVNVVKGKEHVNNEVQTQVKKTIKEYEELGKLMRIRTLAYHS